MVLEHQMLYMVSVVLSSNLDVHGGLSKFCETGFDTFKIQSR